MDLSVDWNSVFGPTIGLAEIVVRGSLMYLGLFLIMRVMARRQAGHFGPADLLVHRLDRRRRPEWARKGLQLSDRGSRPRSHDRSVGIFTGLDRLAISIDTALSDTSQPDADPRWPFDFTKPEQRNDYGRRIEVATARTECRGLCGNQAGYAGRRRTSKRSETKIEFRLSAGIKMPLMSGFLHSGPSPRP